MSGLRSAGRLSLLCLLLFGSCQSASSQSARERESSHLRALVNLYNYAASKLGHRPTNEAEFKNFIAANGAPMLESLHIKNADDLFISERDGEAFVVLYGPAAPGAGHDMVAYERTGVSGRRLLGYSLGAVEEVDEQRFEELVPRTNRSGT